MADAQPITIIGAGLVGALLATLLARDGHAVRVFEKRPDPRRAGFAGGRSINLALSTRGIGALQQAGLAERVIADAVMMRGRMVHVPGQTPNLQRYGVDDTEVNWSVSRGALNCTLLDAAAAAGAELHFEMPLLDAHFDADTPVRLTLGGGGGDIPAEVVIGADGAGSALRHAMGTAADLGERVEVLPHGYKELEIPPASDSSSGVFRDRFLMEPEALHIWPRGSYMAIALPNRNGSFTVTLFMRAVGDGASFAALPDAAVAEPWFRRKFPDLAHLMPTFFADWDAHPVGTLATLYLERWHVDGRALLVGDAAHAIVPFHGQGMNAGFEDAAILTRMLRDEPDSARTFAAFQRRRKSDADAIAAMALENYVEMRDSVADPRFLLKRALADELATRCPGHFMRRYRLVTFTHVPYAWCLARGAEQDRLLDRLLDHCNTLDGFDFEAAIQRVTHELASLPTDAMR